ncbi:YopX family protein [Listeria innocua]|uniref:YopX family protein n=1 Tax=Listeria innocua TaxID=1642 RepID=UPI00165E5F4F|nr:YopX family protein [Listeria innocua]UVW24726.1 YopX family protein [Listeria innocua]
MREIEFRGKAIHPNSLEQIVGSWAYGGIFENKIISRNLDMDSQYHGFISEIEIDIETIGQYTGLKDKNGKKIFEGDIVDISVYDRLDWSSIKGKVVFLNGAWLVVDVGHFAITLQSETNEIEIIGNVHENLGLWEA